MMNEKKARNAGAPARIAAWAMMVWLLAGLALPLPGMAQQTGKVEVEGVTEKLGGQLPMDATFKDQNGRTVTLGEVMTRPTVLAFIFFRCAGICPRLLSGVSDVVNRMPLEPGKDYQIVCISFDPTDQPQEAMRKQREYFALLKKQMPQNAWLFLTGDEANIRKVTDAAGFSYQKDGDMFIHPTTLIVASPHGKIVQYLYGVTYVPSALQMALANAGKEKVGGRVIGALLSCFSNQPKGNAIVSRVLLFTGIAVLLCAGAFVAFLVVTDPKRKAKRREARS